MIKLRLSSMSDAQGDLEIPIIVGELLSVAVDRILVDVKLTKPNSDMFNVTVNGHLIDSDFWAFTQLQENDNVLVAPKIKSKENIGQIFVIVAVAVTAAYTGGAFTPLYAGLINAGVAVAASYIVSKLIPPPIIDSGIGAVGDGVKESQVYSISSQANAVRKFKTVPKVYGYHRMFPIVAATPYTELEADPNTGIYSQYLYAIYDFGLGRIQMGNLRIGTTPITDFDQVSFRYVDPNKPAISEGTWDENLNTTFTLYKGDVSSEDVGTSINGNRDENDPQDDWLTVRNAPTNPNLASQEITVNMICPRGLYAFDSSGNIQTRTIETYIEYAHANSEDWKPFNDPATVSKYSFVGGGGSQAYTDIPMRFVPADNLDPSLQTRYSVIRTTDYTNNFGLNNTTGPLPTHHILYSSFRYIYIGLPAGSTQAILSGEGVVGTYIKVGDRRLAQIDTKTFYANVDGIDYYTYTFVSPTNFPIEIQSSKETKVKIDYYDNGISGPDIEQTTFKLDDTHYAAAKEVIIPGKFQIKASTQQQHFATIKFTPNTPGDYKVRVQRISTSSSSTTQTMDELTWISIVSRIDANPIRTDKRHVFLEIRIKASGQLNGAIQNLSADCTSVLNTFDGTNWVLAPTRNPAWVFCDILAGEVTKKPIALSRLHTPSILEWANYCDQIPTSTTPSITYIQRRYNCDFVLDFEPTVQNMLQQIASLAQATPNMVDGKYGVMLDINRATPTQIFTPRNSWGFESTRNYTLKPHALKVSFIDPSRDWQPNEVTVYDDGYNENNATEIQDLSTFGVTNMEQATRYGRYVAAQHRLRQETISLNVDFENLVCTRGDFVQVTQDVMKVGGTPARVKTKVGNQITIDDKIIVLPVSYGYVYRAVDGTIRTNTLTVDSSDTFSLNGATLPAVGDLIVIGEVGNIVFDCIVKAITPQQDFTANLLLVEKAEALYNFENITGFLDYDPKISPIAGYEDVPPPEVTNLVLIDNYHTITDTDIKYFIHIDWDMPLGSTFEAFEVYVDFGRGYDLDTVLKESEYIYEVNPTYLGIPHNFKVLAVSSTGKKLTLGEVGFLTATPFRYLAPPPDVTGFSSDISGETIHLFWELITGKSVTQYMIRYSPEQDGTWETSTQVSTISSKTNLYSTQARLGKYFIKAINSNNIYSDNAASLVTTVPILPNMNYIATVDDFPTLGGTVDRVIKTTDLTLDQEVYGTLGNEKFYAEGFYYFTNTLDLGLPFSVRLTSRIVAMGTSYSDLIETWDPLSGVPAMSTTSPADWDVELQYRTIENFLPISDWIPLSSVTQLSAGNSDFTIWRKFLVGDATGVLFQFRLKLISYNPSVTPKVLAAEVVAEMSNRSEDLLGLSAPIGGLNVTYANQFYGPGTSPNVQISPINLVSGDYWVISSKSLSGFNIVFYNNLGNPVARQFDVKASGYGRKTTSVI